MAEYWGMQLTRCRWLGSFCAGAGTDRPLPTQLHDMFIFLRLHRHDLHAELMGHVDRMFALQAIGDESRPGLYLAGCGSRPLTLYQMYMVLLVPRCAADARCGTILFDPLAAIAS